MRWDLDCFFKEGSRSEELKKELRALAEEIPALAALLTPSALAPFLGRVQACDIRLRDLESFISCLQAQDIRDERAVTLAAEVATLDASYQTLIHQFEERLLHLDPDAFEALLKTSTGAPIAFSLKERRRRAAEKLPASVEGLISELSVDGFGGWWQVYCALIGHLKVFDLSIGQAENQLSDPDRSVRQSVFGELNRHLQEHETVFAQVLNHLAGFRWKVYAQRGWHDFLKEPLEENRMSAETLRVMWAVVDKGKEPLLKYLHAKAKKMGLPKLSWCDVDAPYLPGKREKIPYETACQLIIEQFGLFSQNMAAFAKKALGSHWVEAEDRPGKRPGGFCTSFPGKQESRIFMTYSGTASNVETLAHELGHAYHDARVQKLPSFAQHYRMNIAETASTFAEMLVIDALVKKSRSPEEKLSYLAEKIERSVIFMMNIHARFLFETAFYERRKESFVSPAELCALMQEAQRQAYRGALDEGHPFFWASKMHFYFTDLSFYNFPYTFGFLFSLGIYAQALKEGPSFAHKYDALLQDSGQMSVEELAQRHLGVDLTQPPFWEAAVQQIAQDVEAFFALASL